MNVDWHHKWRNTWIDLREKQRRTPRRTYTSQINSILHIAVQKMDQTVQQHDRRTQELQHNYIQHIAKILNSTIQASDHLI